MAIRRIIQSVASGGNKEDDAFLHAVAEPVEELTATIQQHIVDLRDTLWAYPICVGLSAPQIGVNLDIIVINPDRESHENDIVLINPKILKTSGKKDRKRESCMSVWGMMGEVERRDKITVEYRDDKFQIVQKDYTGYTSRVIQHEVDHLNGILYLERIGDDSTLTHADYFDQYSIIDDENV